MEQIRYQRRICTDQEKINTFLQNARAGVVGINHTEYPYAVPVNFIWYKGAVYFHGVGSGKKFTLLSEKPNVCFTVYEEVGTVTDPVPCHADTAYMSVMLFGRAERVDDPEEAADVLQQLLGKFMPGFYKQKISGQLVSKYRSSLDGMGVAVFRIVPAELTAKENVAEPDQLFHPS